MRNLQDFNLKELFSTSILKNFTDALHKSNLGISETDNKLIKIIDRISETQNLVTSLFNNLNSNLQTTWSNVILANSVFNLLNDNLLNTVKLFQGINEAAVKSSQVASVLQSQPLKQFTSIDSSSRSGAGTNGTGDPDPKDVDPDLLRLNDIYKRLNWIIDLTTEKGLISTSTGALSHLVPPGASILESINNVNQIGVNAFMKDFVYKNGKNISEDLLDIGVSKEKISSIDWERLANTDFIELFTNKKIEHEMEEESDTKRYSKPFNVVTTLKDMFSEFVDSFNISDIRADVLEIMKKRRDEVDRLTYKNTPSIEISEPYPTPTTREAFYKLNQDILFPGYFPPSFPLKPYGPEKPESEKVASGQNGSRESLLSNLTLNASSRAGKSQKGSSKKEEDPVETMTGVFGEVQKVGGAMSTIMQTLNIGADTFVGGIVNGFNSALTIIQSMIAVMQAVNTIKMFLPFATGGSVPGIGDTDSVPAMLTPGEYVVKKSVVNKFGSGFFEWINGGGLTNSLAGHYAGGGMVAAAGRQMVAVSIPDVKIKGSDLYLSWRRENNTHGRRSI